NERRIIDWRARHAVFLQHRDDVMETDRAGVHHSHILMSLPDATQGIEQIDDGLFPFTLLDLLEHPRNFVPEEDDQSVVRRTQFVEAILEDHLPFLDDQLWNPHNA